MSTPIQVVSTLSPPPVHAEQVRALRSFNRFYTQRIGVLDGYLGSDFSLTETRVLYELAHRTDGVATDLVRDLNLDAGYLSRVLRRFESQGWLARAPSPADRRQSVLTLTPAGHAVFQPLQQQSRDEAAALLAALAPGQRQQALQAMATVQGLLQPGGTAPPEVVLREPGPGDMGWVVQQHGEIYAREYGWDISFDAMVADIAAQFIRNFRPGFDRGWIAEVDGERAGAVFVVRQSATVAKLRMLILTPKARGHGLGGRLTDAAIAFAREAGYKKMQLWTNSCLTAARAIYVKRGFVLTHSEPYRGFGQDLVGETWALRLTGKTMPTDRSSNAPAIIRA